jgi:hypothetical protein
MDTVIGTFFAFAFFFGALAVVVWALYEMSPFARHPDHSATISRGAGSCLASFP